MRSWIRLENREYNQFGGELEDIKDMLCVAFFRLRLSLLRIVVLSLLLLVIGRCGVICKRFETERDADLIGLFEAYAFFHVMLWDDEGAREAQETVTTLYLAIFMSSYPLRRCTCTSTVATS